MSRPIENYRRILQKYQKELDLLSPADQVIMSYDYTGSHDNTIAYISSYVTAPVIFMYVLWVLKDAESNNIRRLYFLARDGYVMYKVAKIIAAEKDIDIDCRYLYCSRKAWRLPTYHLMGEEAFDQICLKSYKTTPKIILQRILEDSREQEAVLNSLGLSSDQSEKLLNKESLESFKGILKKNKIFCEFLEEKSKSAYNTTIKYLEQEGMLEDKAFAIVDTGWTGSMQRSLGRLLSSMGEQFHMSGYYFGMYEKPVDTNAGEEFKCWYFSTSWPIKRSLFFNNNLFECLCLCRDGMTIGYREKDSQIVPIFEVEKNDKIIEWGLDIALNIMEGFASKAVKTIDIYNTDSKTALAVTSRLLRRFMCFPFIDEAKVYGRIYFCDDVSSTYQHTLACGLSENQLSSLLVRQKLIDRLLKIEKEEFHPFWPEGSIKLSKTKFKFLYKMNWWIWNSIWLIRKRYS